MAAAAKGGLKCLEVCGYCCQVVACGIETMKSVWETFTKVCTCGQGWRGLAYNFTTICSSEEDPDYKDFDLPVAIGRRFTDFPGILMFLATLVGMCIAMNRGLTYGRPEVFNNGVDSWSNVCGHSNNIKFSSIQHSGKDMSQYNKLLIVDFLTSSGGIETIESNENERTKICVQICPTVSDTFSCTGYVSKYTGYETSLQSAICSSSPTNKELAFVEKNNRCVPSHLLEDVSVQKQNSLLNLYGQNWLHNLVHDCGICAAELTWLILIALGFTIVFVVIVHAAADALCWYSFATFFVIGVIATGYMWYIFSLINAIDSGVSVYSSNGDVGLQQTGKSVAESDLRTFERSVIKAALQLFPRSFIPSGRSGESVPQAGYSIVFRDAAIYSTVVVVLFSIVCILVGRRNMDACAVLFAEAINAILSLKWLYVLPLLSILSLSFAFGLWMHTLTYITSIFLSGPAVVTDQAGNDKASYVSDTVYTTWVLLFEFVAMIWVFNFVLACQQMITCLAIGTWYFSVDKEDLYRPMRVANSRLIKRHLGSATIGAFLVGYFGILRAPLSFMQSRVVSSMEHARKLKSDQQAGAGGEEEKAEEVVEDTPEDYAQVADDPYGYSAYEPVPSARPYSEAEDNLYDSVVTEQPVGDNPDEEPPYSDYPYYDEVNSVKNSGPDGYVAVEVWNGVNKACTPFFWFLNNVLVYISDLNYSMVALRSCWFVQGGKLMRDRLKKEANLKGIPAISSYALFLGKLTVTLTVLPIGFLLLKDKQGVFMYGYPLAIGALLSFLIAHIFFALFEAAVGAVFVCYVEDISRNEGTNDAPYFGDKNFFRNFQNALHEITSDEAGPYNKIHHAPEGGGINRAKQMRIQQQGKDLLEEYDGYSDVFFSEEGGSSVQTTNETRKKNVPKSKPPLDASSVFLLMPKKKEVVKKKKEPEPSHEYDDVYSEDYHIDQLFEEALDDVDDHESKKKKKDEKKDTKAEKKKDEQKKEKTGKGKKDLSKKTEESKNKKKENTKEKSKGDKHGKEIKDKKDLQKGRQAPDPNKNKDGLKEGKTKDKGKTAKEDNNGKAKDSKNKQKNAETSKDNSKDKQKTKSSSEPNKERVKEKKKNTKDKAKPDKNAKHSKEKPTNKSKVPEKKKKAPGTSKHDPSKKVKENSKRSKGGKMTKSSQKAPKLSPTKTKNKMKNTKKPKVKFAGKKGGKMMKSTKPNLGKKMKMPKMKTGKKMKMPKMKTGKKMKMPKMKMGKKMKMPKMKIGKKMKMPKMKMSKKMKMPKMKMGFNPGKMKGLKMPKMRGGMRGGKMGGPDVMGGVTGAMNVADGLLRITGQKEAVQSKAQQAAFGTRNRAKFTTLMGHLATNRFNNAMDSEKATIFTKIKNTKDLFFGGKEILDNVDKQWDEAEYEEINYQ